jgi:hypothetical protein
MSCARRALMGFGIKLGSGGKPPGQSMQHPLCRAAVVSKRLLSLVPPVGCRKRTRDPRNQWPCASPDEPCSRSLHVEMRKRKQPVGCITEMGYRWMPPSAFGHLQCSRDSGSAIPPRDGPDPSSRSPTGYPPKCTSSPWRDIGAYCVSANGNAAAVSA